MPSLRKNFRKILITRTDRIGDLVLSTPIFSALRKRFPDAWIACLTSIDNRALVEGNLYLDEVILYDKKDREKSFWGNLKLAWGLRRKRFDIVIHFHATNRMHLLTWMAGIPHRIGWTRRLSWALTQGFSDVKVEGKKHEAAYNFDLLAPLGIACPDSFRTFIPVTERNEQSLENLTAHLEISSHKPWIALLPSASCPSKRWPAGSFARVLDFLKEKTAAEILMIGAREDRPILDKIRTLTSTPFHDLTGRLSLGMLAVLLKKSALLISNDSGPVHIAGAVGTPVISIFGRNQPGLSPKRWGPVNEKSKVLWKDPGCVKCLAHDCGINFLCLELITPEEVLESAASLVPGLFHSAGAHP